MPRVQRTRRQISPVAASRIPAALAQRFAMVAQTALVLGTGVNTIASRTTAAKTNTRGTGRGERRQLDISRVTTRESCTVG